MRESKILTITEAEKKKWIFSPLHSEAFNYDSGQ